MLCCKKASKGVLKTHIVEEVSKWAKKLTRPIDDSKQVVTDLILGILWTCSNKYRSITKESEGRL